MLPNLYNPRPTQKLRRANCNDPGFTRFALETRISALATILSAAFLLASCSICIASAPPQSPEVRTSRALEEAAKTGPAALRGFPLRDAQRRRPPLSISDGEIYAETFIRDAAQDGLCVDTAALALKFVKPMATDAQPAPAARLRRGTRPRRLGY